MINPAETKRRNGGNCGSEVKFIQSDGFSLSKFAGQRQDRWRNLSKRPRLRHSSRAFVKAGERRAALNSSFARTTQITNLTPTRAARPFSILGERCSRTASRGRSSVLSRALFLPRLNSIMLVPCIIR